MREYRLFAKNKTKAGKDRMTAELAKLVESVQRKLGQALESAALCKQRLGKYARIATEKVERLHATMKKLVPQLRYWLRTGFVAADKIISLHLPELYSIVRGKVGKKVEFGLNWGIRRLKGGYLLATLAMDRRELLDAKFAVRAVKEHIALFGKAPRAGREVRGPEPFRLHRSCPRRQTRRPAPPRRRARTAPELGFREHPDGCGT